jgi:hypothetical protein
MKIIFHLIIILFISLTSNAQKSNSINLKYGFVFAQNRIKMNQPINFKKTIGTAIGIDFIKIRKKLLYGIFVEYEGAKQEHSITNLDYDSAIPKDFKMYWIHSFINYQFGLQLGYQLLSHKGFNLYGIVSPQLSIYSYNELNTGYKNLYTTNGDLYLVSYDDPTKYDPSVRKNIYTCNPKIQLEINKNISKFSFTTGISFMYYWKYLPQIHNLLIIETQDHRIFPNYYDFSIKPQTINAYLKFGYRF